MGHTWVSISNGIWSSKEPSARWWMCTKCSGTVRGDKDNEPSQDVTVATLIYPGHAEHLSCDERIVRELMES